MKVSKKLLKHKEFSIDSLKLYPIDGRICEELEKRQILWYDEEGFFRHSNSDCNLLLVKVQLRRCVDTVKYYISNKMSKELQDYILEDDRTSPQGWLEDFILAQTVVSSCHVLLLVGI